jgi:CO/xanthine dehydrogenase Mo-binding subunit
LREQLSSALDIPESRLRVIVPYVGGGYGGKIELKAEPFCVVLAKKADRPVKLAFTREEVFIEASVRHPFVVYIKDGVKKDGTIIARQMRMILNGGAPGHLGGGSAKPYRAYRNQRGLRLRDLWCLHGAHGWQGG